MVPVVFCSEIHQQSDRTRSAKHTAHSDPHLRTPACPHAARRAPPEGARSPPWPAATAPARLCSATPHHGPTPTQRREDRASPRRRHGSVMRGAECHPLWRSRSFAGAWRRDAERLLEGGRPLGGKNDERSARARGEGGRRTDLREDLSISRGTSADRKPWEREPTKNAIAGWREPPTRCLRRLFSISPLAPSFLARLAPRSSLVSVHRSVCSRASARAA